MSTEGSENPLSGIQFETFPSDPQVEQFVYGVGEQLMSAGVPVNPLLADALSDPDFFKALPHGLQTPEGFAPYLEHSSRLANLIAPERRRRAQGDEGGLLGAVIDLPESAHADGRVRHAESGYRINVEYLRSQGIDPKKVFFFRLTQPSTTPKPEYYWTSDLTETVRGLTVEVPSHLRSTAIILVSDLDTINQNGGLIQDINDDSGLAVRQIGLDPFDQQNALTHFQSSLYHHD